MECRICTQLEEAVAKAHKLDSPEMTSGLTEAGLRNRALQKQEAITKAEANLEKHKRSCPKWGASPAF